MNGYRMKIITLLVLAASPVAFAQPSGSLPAPFATPAIQNGPKVIPRPNGAQLKLPAGFTVEEYAKGFQRPRFMVEGAQGEVLISDTVANGSVYSLKGGEKKVLLSGLDRPVRVGVLERLPLCGRAGFDQTI